MLTVSLILAGALAAQAPAKTPTADDYVGRWNVKITDAEDTFAGGGFQIDEQGRRPLGRRRLALGQLPAREVGRGRGRDARRGPRGEGRASSTPSRPASKARR